MKKKLKWDVFIFLDLLKEATVKRKDPVLPVPLLLSLWTYLWLGRNTKASTKTRRRLRRSRRKGKMAVVTLKNIKRKRRNAGTVWTYIIGHPKLGLF